MKTAAKAAMLCLGLAFFALILVTSWPKKPTQETPSHPAATVQSKATHRRVRQTQHRKAPVGKQRHAQDSCPRCGASMLRVVRISDRVDKNGKFTYESTCKRCSHKWTYRDWDLGYLSP